LKTPVPKKNPEPRWERRSAERPLEIITAAVRLFSQKGFAATRLDEVAKNAGLSKATLYLYFNSKEHLFEAVIKEFVSPKIDKIEAISDTFDGANSKILYQFFEVLRTFLSGHQAALLKIVVTEANNFPILFELWSNLSLLRMNKLLTHVIERGIEQGEFKKVNVQSQIALVMAPLFMLAMWQECVEPHFSAIRFDKEQIIKSHRDAVIASLLNSPLEIAPRKKAKKILENHT
jgi:AcrR family transcriptional regulator